MLSKAELLEKVQSGSLIPKGDTLEQSRELFEAFAKKNSIVKNVAFNRWDTDAFASEWSTPTTINLNTNTKAILYAHGGSFCIGSATASRGLTSRIADYAQVPVLAIDYPLSPEHCYPAALNSCIAAYQALLKTYSADNIAFLGDSAGGCLVLSTLLQLKQLGLPLPACAAFISPWLDLSLSGKRINDKSFKDPFFTKSDSMLVSGGYLNGVSRQDPIASPFWGEFTGLPPMLIHVGSQEAMLDDALGFTHKAQLSGVEVQTHIYPNVFHVWHACFDYIPNDSEPALKHIVAFIMAHLKR